MKIKVLGSGYESVPLKGCRCRVCLEAKHLRSRTKREVSAVLIDENMLINANRAVSENIEANPRIVLVTNARREVIDGLKKLRKDTPVYGLKDTIKKIDAKLNLKVMTPNKEFEILGHKVTMFDNSAIKIDNFVFAGDLIKMSKDTEKMMSQSSLVFLNSIFSFEDIKKYNLDNIYFTNIKHSHTKHEKLSAYCEKNGYHVTYDGLVLNTMKTKINDAVYLIKPFDKYFSENQIDGFVKPIYNKEILNKPIFVCCGKNVYGVIKTTSIEKVSIDRFNKLQKSHKINDIVRNIWWGNKEPLYFYKFKTLKLFDVPKEYNYKNNRQHFIGNVKICK